MAKNINYKRILFGCAAACLASAAYAQDGVTLHLEPEIGDISCGAQAREYVYELKNVGDDRVQIGYPFTIEIEPEDDFQDANIVSIIPPVAYWECGAGAPADPYYLEPGEVCFVTVEINPTTIDGGCDGESLPATGDIARDIEIPLYNYQRELTLDIDTQVTFLGSADDYTVIAENICTAEDDYAEICDNDDTKQYLAPVCDDAHTPCISGDVAITIPQGFLSSNIVVQGNIDVATTDTANAEADAWGAYNGFLAMAHDVDGGACTEVDAYITENGPYTFNGGVYCIRGQMPVTIDDEVILNNGSMPLVIIIDTEDPVDYVLQITNTGYFTLGETSVPDNIYWVINGNSEIAIIPPSLPEPACPYAMIGTVLTTGYFELDIDTDDPDLASIWGKIFTVSENGVGNDLIMNEDTIISDFK